MRREKTHRPTRQRCESCLPPVCLLACHLHCRGGRRRRQRRRRSSVTLSLAPPQQARLECWRCRCCCGRHRVKALPLHPQKQRPPVQAPLAVSRSHSFGCLCCCCVFTFSMRSRNELMPVAFGKLSSRQAEIFHKIQDPRVTRFLHASTARSWSSITTPSSLSNQITNNLAKQPQIEFMYMCVMFCSFFIIMMIANKCSLLCVCVPIRLGRDF